MVSDLLNVVSYYTIEKESNAKKNRKMGAVGVN